MNSKKNYSKVHPDYFLMIPFDNPKFIEGYNKFCEELKKECPKEFDENLLQKPQKLHITLALFEVGKDIKKLDKIKNILDSIEYDIKKLSEGNITCEFDKFSCFDNIQNTKVIYGKMVEDDSYYRLTKIIDLIIRKLVAGGIIKKENFKQFNINFENNFYNITIHLTLMNTKFLNKGNKEKKKMFFNSQSIMDFISKLKLPICELDKFNLCKMGADEETGLYEIIKNYSLI